MIKIYLILCKATDKSFVGFTQQKHTLGRIRHRLETDARRFGATGNSLLLADVLKYGISAFSFAPLEICHEDQRSARLPFWINYFDCIQPKGYNRGSDLPPTPQEATDEQPTP